tara:strand:+ start:1358 stop:1951 length:594 start_codon:yes stop_codon:yes gene_type:complete
MGGVYTVKDNIIVIDRELTDLDLFVKDFLEVLKKYSDYLIVSGFVSISTGRTRGTEDVDILVPTLEKEQFTQLFAELHENGFWCYQGDNPDDVYDYVKDLISVRFARVNEMYPNMEFIPINQTKKAKYFEFTHPQKIRVQGFEFKIPPIEFEILYKEIVLCGDKDFQDARHLRTIFSEIIKEEKFKEYESIVRTELE